MYWCFIHKKFHCKLACRIVVLVLLLMSLLTLRNVKDFYLGVGLCIYYCMKHLMVKHKICLSSRSRATRCYFIFSNRFLFHGCHDSSNTQPTTNEYNLKHINAKKIKQIERRLIVLYKQDFFSSEDTAAWQQIDV